MAKQLQSRIQIWDIPSGQQRVLREGTNALVFGLTFSPDGRHVAGESLPLDAVIEMVGKKVEGKENKDEELQTRINVWETATGQSTLARDGAGASGLIGMLRGVSLDKLGIGLLWQDQGPSLMFSQDGARLLAVGWEPSQRSARVWDLASGDQLLTLRGLSAAAFSPDGKRLATASRGDTVKVWETLTGHEMLTLRGHKAPVTSVAFSRDSQRLASGDERGNVIIWDARPRAEEQTCAK